MKISVKALYALLQESIQNNRIISERPWAVEYAFTLSGKSAEDSEGSSADGFSIDMTSSSGTTMAVTIDSYWNPQAGDQSGNSIKVTINGDEDGATSTYVPHKFDDGKKQKILISNSPVAGVLTVSHSIDESSPPIVYLAISNPFEENDDIEFSTKSIGNGRTSVEMTGHINL